MFIKELTGHSGCRVLLYEENDETYYVRKIASTKEYNDRLKKQAFKQKNFVSDTLCVPKIIRDGVTADGLYFFDMEYIQGITLAEKIKTLEVSKIRAYVTELVLGLINSQEECNGVSNLDVNDIFDRKIGELSTILREKNRYKNIEIAVSMLKEHDWSKLQQSRCHGDMTLENIIIKDNEMYLIDFLDSFYDSWALDVSTLFQDALIMWSYRNDESINNNTLIRLMIFNDILVDIIKEKCSHLLLDIYYLLLLKMVRIYPYTVCGDECVFLDESISEIIDIINGMGQ